MPADIMTRLRTYYQASADTLVSEARKASLSTNPSDLGGTREDLYVKFLTNHLPSKCSVLRGGSLFDDDGHQSAQMDVIVTTDTTPRIPLGGPGNAGKFFAPVEGTLGVASIKSKLNKAGLLDALSGLASIPATTSLQGRVVRDVSIHKYEDWPYKIIFAYSGSKVDTISRHLIRYYRDHPDVPTSRTPHVIHVAGEYTLLRHIYGMNVTAQTGNIPANPTLGHFIKMENDPDLHAVMWVLHKLQENAAASTYIHFNYGTWINAIANPSITTPPVGT
jgi:uncharacterized protein DUF6602